jgi:hypothetical protein
MRALLAPALLAPLLAPLLAAPLQAASADSGMTISRWNNTLIVTAPGGDAGGVRLTAGLTQKVTVDFKEASIESVADFLRQITGANIVVAPGVAALGTTITLKAADMSLGNVLTWVKTLAGIHIGFIHGAIFLSDKEIAGDTVTRLYDVSDLVLVHKDFPGPELAMSAPSGMGGGGAKLLPPMETTQTAPTTDELVEMIKKVVAPGQWSD